MKNESKCVVVLTTVDSEGIAGKMSGLIVGERVAACVQYVRLNSTYHWKDKLVMNEEYLLIAKTTADKADELVAFIKKHHAYEVPEIIVLPIIGGYAAYLDWLASETRSAPK